MKLHDYLKSLSPEEKKRFAARCGTSLEYLHQIGYGSRKPKAALAIAIERESAAAVRCEELLPELDWEYLRTSARTAALSQ